MFLNIRTINFKKYPVLPSYRIPMEIRKSYPNPEDIEIRLI